MTQNKHHSTLKKALSLLLAAAMCCSVLAMGFSDMLFVRSYAGVTALTEFTTTAGGTISDGRYVVKADATLNGSGGPGLVVSGTVLLYIPAGVTLTVTGDNAASDAAPGSAAADSTNAGDYGTVGAVGTGGDGASGGYAGILVPSGATLIITGEGTLIATGGRGGNAAAGGKGGKGQTQTYGGSDRYRLGAGGSGGGGGGAAGGGGAGIGTNGAAGGAGSAGGKGGQGRRERPKALGIYGYGAGTGTDDTAGSSGVKGNDGNPSAAAGSIYKLGNVTVAATGGASGNASSSGGNRGGNDSTNYNGPRVSASGGAGGGAGGAGGSGYGIGAGGPGGGGGGGGTGGGYRYDSGDDEQFYRASGGKGGTSNGADGTDNDGTDGTSPTPASGGGVGDYGSGEGFTSGTPDFAKITVTLNSNGGTGGAETVTATIGCDIPTVTDLPTMDLRTFNGYWSTAEGGTQYIDENGASVHVWDGYLDDPFDILYAQWSAINSTVVINPNGGEWNGATTTSTYQNEAGEELTIAPPTREGYDFTGWAKSRTQGETTTNDALFGALNETDEATHAAVYTYGVTSDVTDTLTAQWQLQTNDITYKEYDGNSDLAVRSVDYNANDTYTPTSANGWTFVGWATTANATVADAGAVIQNVTAPATYYAVWTHDEDATFHYTNAAGEADSTVKSGAVINDGAGAGAAVSAPSATEVGNVTVGSKVYSFLGWAANSTDTQGSLTAFETGNSYFATYSASVALTYAAPDAANVPANDSATSYYNFNLSANEAVAFTVGADPQKDGHTFTGWLGSDGVTYQANDTVTTTGDFTLTATWQKHVFDITFVVDGAETVVPTEYNENPVFGSTPARDSTEAYTYTFIGWTVASDGSGTVYAPDAPLPAATAAATYYAKFREDDRYYLVTFNDEDGSQIATESVKYNTRPVYATIPTKAEDEGHTYAFDGWKNGDDVYAYDGLPVITDEITFTATYKATKKSFAVTFVYKDTTGNQTKTVYVPYQEGVAAENVPAVADYIRIDSDKHYHFTGWDGDFSNITAALTVNALFDEEAHTHPRIADKSKVPNCSTGGYDWFECACGDYYITDVEMTSATVSNHAWETDASEQIVWRNYDETYHAAFCQNEIALLTAQGESTDPANLHHLNMQPHNWAEDASLRVAATHTADGQIVYVCDDCGATKTVTVPHGEHTWDYDNPVNTATCTAAGKLVLSCTDNDGATLELDVPALGHAFAAGETVEATCMAYGYTEYACSRPGCDASYTAYTPGLGGHAAGELDNDTVKAATCTACGYSGDTICPVCGNILAKGEIIAPNGHAYTAWTANDDYDAAAHTGTHTRGCGNCDFTETENCDFLVYVSAEATCAAEGERTYVCKVCGRTETESIDRAEHLWVLTRTVEPTCTAAGSKTWHCPVCGNDKTEAYGAALEHDTTETVIPPTCTEDGYTLVTCSRCDYTATKDPVVSGDHTWEFYTTKTPATCADDGVAVEKCSVCGAIRETAINADPNAHTWGSWTYNDDEADGSATHTRTCTVCGTPENGACEFAELFSHPVTCTADGITVYRCAICGGAYEAVTEALHHDYGAWVYDEAAKTHSRVCGNDASHTETQLCSFTRAVTDEPTCEGAGTATYTCAVCGGTYTEEIPALGHLWEGACTDNGDGETHTETCGRAGCGATRVLNHGWRITASAEATATTDGYIDFLCDACGATKHLVLHATAAWDEGAVLQEPTCTEPGIMRYTATDGSGAINDVPIPATGHTPGEGTVHAPTCTAEGYTEYVCGACGYTYRDSFTPATGHTPKETRDNVVEATATCGGYTGDLYCAVCGELIEAGHITPATGSGSESGFARILEALRSFIQKLKLLFGGNCDCG